MCNDEDKWICYKIAQHLALLFIICVDNLWFVFQIEQLLIDRCLLNGF